MDFLQNMGFTMKEAYLWCYDAVLFFFLQTMCFISDTAAVGLKDSSLDLNEPTAPPELQIVRNTITSKSFFTKRDIDSALKLNPKTLESFDFIVSVPN